MKIKSVRARVFEWKGKTVPPQGNFCSNAMDLLYSKKETMATFRFHSWTVVEIETDETDERVQLIAKNLIKHGTIYNVLSAAIPMSGEIRKRAAS